MKSTALAASMLVFVSVGAALSQNAPPGNPTNTGFMAQQPNDRLASRLVGLNIQNTGDENIGEIRHDLARLLIGPGDVEASERLNVKLPTSGLAVIDFAGKDWRA